MHRFVASKIYPIGRNQAGYWCMEVVNQFHEAVDYVIAHHSCHWSSSLLTVMYEVAADEYGAPFEILVRDGLTEMTVSNLDDLAIARLTFGQ